MKIAVYSDSSEWNRYIKSCFRLCEEVIQPLEVDFFNSKHSIQKRLGVKPYDLILIYDSAGKMVSKGMFLDYLEGLWERW